MKLWRPILAFVAVYSITNFLCAQTTSVDFHVNMNEKIAQGAFNTATEYVDIAGSFNGWDGSNNRFSDDDADGIYSTTVEGLTIGTSIEFKARINGEWNGREEFPGGGPNRNYTVEENGIVEFWYNDELPDTVLQVSISISSVNNIPGQTVQFFDQSSGDPVAWEWQFEGASPSTSNVQNPIVFYPEEGKFDVTLTIYNESGSSESKTFNDYVNVGVFETYWWNDAIFYEIFVRSFYDSNADGIGDFQGLIDKLDYLNDGNPATHDDLGVTGIWLMPIHQSPSYHGYDVTDYRTIERDYGSNEDFKAFIEAAHARGINVIIDYVMNHSSSEHPWFEASKDASAPERDWYTWRDTNPGGSGPWGQTVWHESGSDYYYGLFWGGMPDLNYQNETLKTEMFDVATFWLDDMNVDGFRLDAVKYIYEVGSQLEDTQETFDFWKEFRTHYKGINNNAFAVGEAWTSTDKVKKYVEADGLDYCFEFDLANAILNTASNGATSGLKSKIDEVMSAYPYLQFGTFLTNHDINRVMDVLGRDESKARLASQLLLTLPGVPYLYYGEEIGMIGSKPDEDIRRPMQWNDEEHAGFSTAQPWRSPYADYTTKNVEAQQKDHSSLWHNYHDFITLRNNHIAMRRGNYKSVTTSTSSAFAFLRQHETENILVLSNVSSSELQVVSMNLDLSGIEDGNYILQNLLDGSDFMVTVTNGGFEDLALNDIPARSTYLYKFYEHEEDRFSSVLYQVDMNDMIAANQFDPTSESVTMIANDITGTNLFSLADENEDGIYELMLADQPVGKTMEYRYGVGDLSDGSEEFYGTDIYRKYRVSEGENEVLDDYQFEVITTSIGESEGQVIIYPNPANGVIWLSMELAAQGNYFITDVKGKTVQSGLFKREIPIQNLITGIYFLQLEGVGSFKFIVEQ